MTFSTGLICKTLLWWEQRWCSYESTRLPPTWLGLKSRRRRHIWHEFVVGSLPCLKRFSFRDCGIPLSSKINTFKIQFDPERVDTFFHEFLRTPKYLVGKQITFRITITYVAAEVLYHNIRSKISLTSNHIGSFEPTHGSIAIGTENNSYFLASSYTQNGQPPSEPAHSSPAPTHSPPLPATPGICVR